MHIHEVYEHLWKKLSDEERGYNTYKAMAEAAEAAGDMGLAKGLYMICDDKKSHWDYIRKYMESHDMSVGDSLDMETAEKWMRNIHNADGSVGAHWPLDHVKQVMAQKAIMLDPLAFWVTMNMMYSDYYCVAKDMNMNNIGFYSEMAKAFLDDEDAVKDKLAAYYKYVVKK